MNKTNLTGRVTKEIELRYAGETATVSFNLAVNRKFKKDGHPEADFIACVAWGKTSEIMAQYLSKGSHIGVSGRIQTRNYENKKGDKVYVTEVVVEEFDFLDSKKDRDSGSDFHDTDIDTSDIPF